MAQEERPQEQDTQKPKVAEVAGKATGKATSKLARKGLSKLILNPYVLTGIGALVAAIFTFFILLYMFNLMVGLVAGLGAAGAASCATPDTSSSSATGDWTQEGTNNYKTAKNIYLYLREKEGFTTQAAAGVLAVVQRESSFNPNAVNTAGGVAGFFQWSGYNGNSVNGGRWTSHGHRNDDFSFSSQMKLMHDELNSNYANVKATVGKLADPAEAAMKWSELYEGVSLSDGQSKLDQITAWANTAFKTFANVSTAGSNLDVGLEEDSTNALGCSITDISTSENLFDTNQKGFILTDGINGPGHGGQHDGWDVVSIADPSGTKGENIYSLLNGTVIGVAEGNRQTEMPYIAIKSNFNGKQVVIQYQEFEAESIPRNLKVGTTVAAGAKIGKMGTMFPDGQTSGSLTRNGYSTSFGLGGDLIAASSGNHLHFSYKKYVGQKGSVANWAADENTLDPGTLYGMKAGIESGQWTWGQLKLSQKNNTETSGSLLTQNK